MISKGFPVDWAEPWVVTATEIAPVLTPRPICFALVPPVPVVALGPEADWVVWLISSEKLIGSLAGNSSNMASNIAQISNEVLEIVSQLVKSAEEVSNIMLEISDENSAEKAKLLNDYNEALQTCYDTMAEIAQSNNEISNSVDFIRESMDAIDVAVEENAQGITTVAEGSSDLVETSHNVLNCADNVGDISETLQGEVEKFII